jgi:hypothetical protein
VIIRVNPDRMSRYTVKKDLLIGEGNACIWSNRLIARIPAEEDAMSQQSKEGMSKEQLIQGFADAFEQVIGAAIEAERRGVTRQGDRWGPREIVAHMAGWTFSLLLLRRCARGCRPSIIGGWACIKEVEHLY